MDKSSGRKEVLHFALREALSSRDLQRIRYLVDKQKLDPNKFPRGSTLLHAVIEVGDESLMRYVFSHPKTNVAKTNEDGHSPLQYAILHNLDMAEQLLSLLSPAQLPLSCPYKPLTHQIQPAKRMNSNTKKSIHLLSLLTAKYPLPCSCRHLNAHEAMKKNNAYFLDAFLSAGADVNEENTQSESLLQSAAQYGHLPTIRTIVMHGAKTWDSANRDICDLPGLTDVTVAFIRQLRKRRAVFYILKFRDKGVRLFSGLSFWLIKEIIAMI